MDRKEGFWSGFAGGALVGAAAGIGAWIALSTRGTSYNSRILRLERSVQIGRPVEEVFAAWSDFEQLPRWIDILQRVEASNQHSRWLVLIDGKEFSFDAETTQFIPDEAIGWKSISGPKHSGRINFAKLGNDTLVHVTMNYAPPLGRFGRLLSPITDHLESYIELALRGFKNALESNAEGTHGSERGGVSQFLTDRYRERYGEKGPASAGWDEYPEEIKATGTEGRKNVESPSAPSQKISAPASSTRTGAETSSSLAGANARERQGQPGNTGDKFGSVDYTRPPKDRY